MNTKNKPILVLGPAFALTATACDRTANPDAVSVRTVATLDFAEPFAPRAPRSQRSRCGA
jgi:hypothetical protein